MGLRGQLWLPAFESAAPESFPRRGLDIVADASEGTSGIPTLLRQAGACVSVSKLPAGDYLIGHRVLVERKAAGDFVGSMMDGRLFRQLHYLKGAAMATLLVIEGGRAAYESFWPERLRAGLLAAAVDFRMPILFTRKPDGTAALLLALARRCAARGGFERFEPSSRRKLPFSGRARRLAREFDKLASLPGIGPRLALRLLGRFNDLKSLGAASEAEWLEVPGIGSAKAAVVRQGLNRH